MTRDQIKKAVCKCRSRAQGDGAQFRYAVMALLDSLLAQDCPVSEVNAGLRYVSVFFGDRETCVGVFSDGFIYLQSQSVIQNSWLNGVCYFELALLIKREIERCGQIKKRNS